MIALVQEYGLVPGSRKDKFDYDELEQQIVQEHPEFVWIRLEPDGTTLSITVKERLPDEQLEKQRKDNNKYTNEKANALPNNKPFLRFIRLITKGKPYLCST